VAISEKNFDLFFLGDCAACSKQREEPTLLLAMIEKRHLFKKMKTKIVNLLHLSIIGLLIMGMMGCGSSRKMVLDPGSRDFYETARLIMNKQEMDIFNHLPDQKSSEEFIRDFWEKRDPDPDTEENEFKEEFFRRIVYANKHFKEGPPGWKTDRGRIYIYFGPPDKIEQSPFLTYPDIKGYMLWVYYRYNLAVEFVDKRGDGSYTFDPYSGIHGSFFDALERVKFGLVSEDEFTKKLADFDLEFHNEKKEIVVSIPVSSLTFIEEEGLLKADFEFDFYIYRKKEGEKQSFREIRHFEKPEEEVLRLKNIVFTFSFNDLRPGKYYLDVVIIGQGGIGRTRKIFEIKV